MTVPSRDLPHGLRIFVEAAGEDAALAIALAYGGGRLYVPGTVELGNGTHVNLAHVVGVEAAELIVRHLGGDIYQIPIANRVVNRWLRERGWNQVSRCRRLRVARSTARYWDIKDAGGNVAAWEKAPWHDEAD